MFVSPWLIGFLIFTLYPVIASGYLSFTDYRVLAPPHWVGMANYHSLVTDHDYFLPSLWDTIFMFLDGLNDTELSCLAIFLCQTNRLSN